MKTMDFCQVREELVSFSHKIQAMGYTQGSGGNLSCRVSDTGLYAIKRTAANLGEMTAADVLIVDGSGQVVDGQGIPSQETGFHLGLYQLRPSVGAVVHCHPSYSIAFANCGLELPHTTCTSRKIVGRVPCVLYAPPGSNALREAVVRAFADSPESVAVLMREHGICTVGKTLSDAFQVADIVEQTAKQAYLMLEISRNRAFFEGLKERTIDY